MMQGDWSRAASMARTMVQRFDQAKRKTLVRIGTYLEARLKKGMTDQAPGGKPYQDLHPFTIAQRQKGIKRGQAGSKALIHRGDLRNSITHQEGPNHVFIGVLRGEKKTEGGMDLANLAEIHEQGRVIAVTPKMRAWLHANGLHLAPDTTHIVIPARPTFGPTLEAEEDEVLRIMADTMQKEMGRL